MTSRDSHRERWRGIHRHGAGWRAVVSWPGRTPVKRTFPLDTPVDEMQTWRADQLATFRRDGKQRLLRGTFAADADRYLDLKRDVMPSFASRRREIDLWKTIFGRRQRDTITRLDILAARNAWIVAPRSATDARPVGPNTINKRIRALANLWTTLDGPHAENPARELLDDELEEPEPIERDLPDTDVVRLFAHMPDVGSVQAGHAGDRRPTVSKTKIVLRVLAFTGMTPSTFARLRPEHVRLEERLLRLPRRRKGRGVAGTWVPIIEPAAWALQAVEEHGLWGYRLSNSSANKSLRVAAARAGIAQRLTIHALRHSFGSIVFDATGNLELVAYLLQQMHLGTTMRYVLRRLATTRQQQLAPVEGRLAGALDAPPVPVPVRRAAPVEPGRCRCGAPIDQTARDPRGRAITRCRLCLDRRRRYRQATGTKTGTN